MHNETCDQNVKLQDGLCLSMYTWLALSLGTFLSHVNKVRQRTHNATRCNYAALPVHFLVPISSCADNSIQINVESTSDVPFTDVLYIHDVCVFGRGACAHYFANCLHRHCACAGFFAN